jgi:hypothetical protein
MKMNMNMNQETMIILVVLAVILLAYFYRENFLPNSKEIPPCPLGTQRHANGLDCRVMGDNM